MAAKGKFENKGSRSLVSVSKGTTKSKKTPVEAQKPAPRKAAERKPAPAAEKKAVPAPEKKAAPQPEKKAPPAKKKSPPVKEAKEEKKLTPLQMIWEVIKTIFTYLIMAVSVAMMLFTAISVSSFDRNDRDLFGYKAFIVRSDSMKATDFAAGDLVIIKEVDTSTLQVGDIIAFVSEDPESLGETFTHKIRQIDTDDFGLRSFVTYGTTTDVDDLYPVSQDKVLGQYIRSVPKMGEFFAFMKTTPGYICCIFVPFLALLLINGGSVTASTRQIYKDKEEAAEAEHQAKMDSLTTLQETILTQQQQMQGLMQQMIQLQEELQKKSGE